MTILGSIFCPIVGVLCEMTLTMKLSIALLLSLLLFSSVTIAQRSFSYEAFYSIDDLTGTGLLPGANNIGLLVHYDRSNYTAGVNTRWTNNQKLFLVSGIGYSKQEITKSFNCDNCGISPLRENQRYLQVPLGVSYRILKSKLSPEVESGILNNLLFGSNTNDILGNETPKGFYLSAYLGGRINYQAYEYLGFSFGYRRMNSLTPVFSDDFTFRSNSYFVGIAFTPSAL